MRSPLPDLKHWPGHRGWWFVALVALQAGWAGAQALVLPPSPELAEAALTLQSSGQLQELIAPEVRRDLPVFVSGERLYGRPDLETVIEGGAQLRKGDIVIQADRLEYYQPDDQARARGQVRVNRAGNVYEGPLLELKLESFEGFFSQPRYYFRNNDAHGEAARLDFLDEHRTVIRQATLTTCTRQPGPGW
ncbi:MAG: LPS-assembly protein LptD, partial [Burkholderiales bacterium]|nr:LPS-assembly protein LptD [Burkholderiales bacterium]